VLRPIFRDVGALLAGVLSVCSFAPFSLWFVAPCALALFFWCCHAPSHAGRFRRTFLRGWLFGVGQFSAGIFWIAQSFQFNHIPYPLAVVATSGLVAVLALYPACYAGAMSRLVPAATWSLAPALAWPGAWVGIEWLRGTLFTGFTWLQLGGSQIDGPFSGWYPLLGTYGVGLLVAGLGSTLVWGCYKRTWRAGAIGLGVVAASALVSFLIDGQVLGGKWTRPAGEPLTFALVQGNVSQGEKWKPENKAPTLARYLSHSRANWNADVIVWPETAVPGLLTRMTPFLDEVEREARSHGAEVIVGIPSVDPQTRRPVNVVVALGTGSQPRAGTRAGTTANDSQAFPTYVKRHLVPFGEYLPLPRWFGPIVEAIGLRLSNFQSGRADQPLLMVSGHPVGVTVCYEIAFSHDVRTALPQARLLLNVSNDAWFGDTLGPHQHLEMARVRAKESGRYVVRSTNTGITAIIDSDGVVRAAAEQFVDTVLVGQVVPRSGATPYVRVGDVPVVGTVLVLLFVGVALSNRAVHDGAQTRENS
jgi:apolipoprotein N-acyltransferase